MKKPDLTAQIMAVETELKAVRKQIVSQEADLARLEQERFKAEQELDDYLHAAFTKLKVRLDSTRAETKAIEKRLKQKINELDLEARKEKVANAVAEEKVLRRQLDLLRRTLKEHMNQKGSINA